MMEYTCMEMREEVNVAALLWTKLIKKSRNPRNSHTILPKGTTRAQLTHNRHKKRKKRKEKGVWVFGCYYNLWFGYYGTMVCVYCD